MSRHDLPSGGWVELRDPTSITGGERKDYISFVEGLGDSFRDISAGGEALMALVLVQWSFPQAQPKLVHDGDRLALLDVGSFDQLLSVDYDMFADLLEPYQAIMFSRLRKKESPLDPKVEELGSGGSAAS